MLLHSQCFSISFMINIFLVMNVNVVLKEITILQESPKYSRSLKIKGIAINVDDLGVRTSIRRLTKKIINQIMRVFDALQIYFGKQLTKEQCMSLTYTVQVKAIGNENYDICYKSAKCEQIISWYNLIGNQMCRTCQNDISYEKRKTTVKSSGQLPLTTFTPNKMYHNNRHDRQIVK